MHHLPRVLITHRVRSSLPTSRLDGVVDDLVDEIIFPDWNGSPRKRRRKREMHESLDRLQPVSPFARS